MIALISPVYAFTLTRLFVKGYVQKVINMHHRLDDLTTVFLYYL
jgi:hypothetical protein